MVVPALAARGNAILHGDCLMFRVKLAHSLMTHVLMCLYVGTKIGGLRYAIIKIKESICLGLPGNLFTDWSRGTGTKHKTRAASVGIYKSCYAMYFCHQGISRKQL